MNGMTMVGFSRYRVLLKYEFSDLEVIALSATAEALGIDSENLLFNPKNVIRIFCLWSPTKVLNYLI